MPDLTVSIGEPGERDRTEPGERECLRCYVMRMVAESGCDNSLRWTIRWRDLRAPRSTGLLNRLARRGGICCDCEVAMNVFWPDYPAERLLTCGGVSSAGSTEPCELSIPAGREEGG